MPGGGGVLPEHRHLTLEAVNRPPHVRLSGQHGGVVDQIAGGEVVGAVHDQVVLPEQVDGVGGLQPKLVQSHVDQRVDGQNRVARRLGLGPSDIGHAMDDLPLQVGLVDDVEVDDADGAHPGRGQVEQGGCAEPAGADHERPGVLEPLLTVDPEVGNDQMAAVAGHLIATQLGCGFD